MSILNAGESTPICLETNWFSFSTQPVDSGDGFVEFTPWWLVVGWVAGLGLCHLLCDARFAGQLKAEKINSRIVLYLDLVNVLNLCRLAEIIMLNNFGLPYLYSTQLGIWKCLFKWPCCKVYATQFSWYT